MALRRVFFWLALAPLLGLPRTALAGDCAPLNRVSTCLDADNLWHRAGTSQFLSIAGSAAVPSRQIGFGFLVSYQKRPVVFRLPSAEPGGSDAYAIDNQVNGSLVWSVGMGAGLELTAVAPVTLYQDGVGVSPLQSQQSTPVVRSAIRDLRLGLHANLIRRPGGYVSPGLSLGAAAELVLPTGAEEVYAGGQGVGVAPSVSLDYRVGPVVVGAEVAARIRPTVEVSGTSIGPQLYQALGVSVDVLGEKLSVAAEAFVLEGFGDQKVLSRDASGIVVVGDRSLHAPAEWLLSVRSAPALAGDLTAHLGGGTSLPLSSNDVTSPAFRLVAGLRYAPVGRDSDQDGILDKDDKCPSEPEDKDGFEDEDGCPDPDNDRDGILDARDRCRDAAEDRDGFQDDDGCPDPDDDQDGVLDADDRCRNESEDKDSYQDEDGCPEPDNDSDGILDKDDVCPNGPEDKDGFKDEDGCPDPDNDADGILDEKDQCPLQAEDRDGFQDEDGCPEPDNDVDGILDKADKCPNEAETINGVDDDDGCPEAGATELVSVEKGKILVKGPLRFAAGKATMTPALEQSLRMAAQKARATPNVERILVETYGDGGAGARQEALASERAEAVRKVLLAAQLPADLLTVAVGDLGARRPGQAPHVDVQLLQKRVKK